MFGRRCAFMAADLVGGAYDSGGIERYWATKRVLKVSDGENARVPYILYDGELLYCYICL